MSLSLESRHCGSVYIISCRGRIVSGEESAVLEAALERGMCEFTRVVLDVSRVDRIDSAGMGLLVRFLWHARNRKGDVRLATPTESITHLLKVTKLDSVFQICGAMVLPSKDHALARKFSSLRMANRTLASLPIAGIVLNSCAA